MVKQEQIRRGRIFAHYSQASGPVYNSIFMSVLYEFFTQFLAYITQGSA